MKREITEELINSWREALTTDPTAAENVLAHLRLHEEHGTVSPDMEILSTFLPLSQAEIIEGFEEGDDRNAPSFFRSIISE